MKAPNGAPDRFISAVLNDPPSACVVWPYARDRAGYARYNVGGKVVFAHRYLCESTHGAAPSPIHQAAHLCGRGADGCVNPRHIAWKTPKENNGDKVTHGTVCRGSRHGRAKLTEQDVRDIKDLASNSTLEQVAYRYGISFQHVGKIVRGKKWKHLNLVQEG
jgi:hypothetical protein